MSEFLDVPDDQVSDLQRRADAYYAANFGEHNLPPEDDPSLASSLIREFKKHSYDAVGRVVHLLHHAEKDSTQLAAAKLILEWSAGAKVGSGDGIDNLIKALQADG